MTERVRMRRQQTKQRCAICTLFQNIGIGQYRSSYDRGMYLKHLQTSHGAKLAEEHGFSVEASGGALKR